MVLVTLVVIGHAMVLLPSSELKSQAYDFIYYFHIPAFVLVTATCRSRSATAARTCWRWSPPW